MATGAADLIFDSCGYQAVRARSHHREALLVRCSRCRVHQIPADLPQGSARQRNVIHARLGNELPLPSLVDGRRPKNQSFFSFCTFSLAALSCIMTSA
jgi:hypothetical protein